MSGDGLVVQDANGVVRVTVGEISQNPPDYGLQVTGPQGGPGVILDGTSDMFRIAATGTVSLAIPANGSNATSTVLSGLGSFTTPPAHSAFLTDSALGPARYAGIWIYLNLTGTDVEHWGYFATDLVGGQCRINWFGVDNAGAAWTLSGRYYVIEEVTI
jgi:hypothetical protein